MIFHTKNQFFVLFGRVSEPHPIHADPDPGLEIFADADPDPGCEIFADPDPELDFLSIIGVFYVSEVKKGTLDLYHNADPHPDPGTQRNADLDSGTQKMRIRIRNPAFWTSFGLSWIRNKCSQYGSGKAISMKIWIPYTALAYLEYVTRQQNIRYLHILF